MTVVTLVYPYFHPRFDTSIFRFPPLGLGYIAAFLKQKNITVEIVDCTFLTKEQALKKIVKSKPNIIGIQSMYSMRDTSLELARDLRGQCDLLVAGGALPTINPELFLSDFDVAVVGEGERTMLELVNLLVDGGSLAEISGIAYKDKETGQVRRTSPRPLISELDLLPFPSRDLFDNTSYKNYYYRKFGYKTTAILTSRGCPFTCDFCSKPIFGNEFRTRSASKIVDEIETIISFGYDRIWFADDCFTLNRERLIAVCDGIIDRKLRIGWECLSRVDTFDSEIADKMKKAGCLRIFFGIESGNDFVLRIMKKQITTKTSLNCHPDMQKERYQSRSFLYTWVPWRELSNYLGNRQVRFISSLGLSFVYITLSYPSLEQHCLKESRKN